MVEHEEDYWNRLERAPRKKHRANWRHFWSQYRRKGRDRYLAAHRVSDNVEARSPARVRDSIQKVSQPSRRINVVQSEIIVKFMEPEPFRRLQVGCFCLARFQGRTEFDRDFVRRKDVSEAVPLHPQFLISPPNLIVRGSLGIGKWKVQREPEPSQRGLIALFHLNRGLVAFFLHFGRRGLAERNRQSRPRQGNPAQRRGPVLRRPRQNPRVRVRQLGSRKAVDQHQIAR